MSDATVAMVLLFAGTYALKAAGPLALAGRALPDRITRLAELLPAGLLAALVAVSTLGADQALQVDARLAGVVAAGVALWRKAPFVIVVLIAVVVTAAVRALA